MSVISLETFLDLARSRRSIRRFKADPVPREILEQLIEAAGWAPSSGNLQDWRFKVVTSGPAIEQVAQVVSHRWESLLAEHDKNSISDIISGYTDNFTWFSRAPALIVISSKRTEAFFTHLLGEKAHDVSGRKASSAMAAQNIMLAAKAAGLGSCCLTGPLVADKEINSILSLEKRQDLVCLLVVGWPEEEPETPPRRPINEIAEFLE